MAKSGEKFAYIPKSVVDSDAYLGLRTRAPILLSVVAAKYTGSNNGDLAVTYNEMLSRGWARDTTARAFSELLDKGLLFLTRKGGRNRCSLYALSWLPVSDPAVIKKLNLTGGIVPTNIRKISQARPKSA